MAARSLRLPLLIAAALSVSALALAQGALRFELEPGCPTEEYFWTEVSSRLDGAEPKALLGSGILRTAREGSEHVGSLELEGLEERFVHGVTCAEVMSALALIAVLRIREADANTPSAPAEDFIEPEPEGEKPNASPAEEAAPGAAIAEAPVAAPAAPAQPVLAALPAARRAAPDSRSSPVLLPPSTRSWSADGTWLVGAGGFVVTGPAPSALVGPSAFAERVWGGRVPLSLGAALEAGWSRKSVIDVGAAKFRWWVARATGCIEAMARGPVGLWPCLEMSGGVTEAIGLAGAQIEEGWREPQGWAAGGAALTARVAVARNWLIDLGGGAAISAVRHRTLFKNPDGEVHVTEAFSLTGRARLSYRLSL